MKLDSRHILILLGLALALSSCVQFSGQEGMAQLYPPVFEVDVTVEDLAQTKAEPAKPVPVAPTYPEVHFTVKDKDGNVVYDKLGVWDDPLKLPIGAYSIEAYSGSNTFGSAYFTGGASGTVAAGKEETPTISMALKNAYLAVGLTETLAKHFKTSGNCITISTASASIDAALDTYVFVPSGQELSITIAGTSSADMPKTITHSLAARTAATATYLSCDMTTTNAPTITLKGTPEVWGTVGYITAATTANISPENVKKVVYIAEASDNPSSKIQGTVEGTNVAFEGLTPGTEYSVYATIGALQSNKVDMIVATISTEANHTKNSSSELDGTDFTALINIPEKFKGDVENVYLTLSNGMREKTLGASEIEWNSDGSIVWNSDGSEETSWPYLPQDSYTLKGTVSYKNGTKNAYFTKFKVSAPTFTVNTPSAYTNYNTYLTSGAAAANKEDGSTIYGIANNGVKISNNILQNANYSQLIGGYTYFIDGNSANEGKNANQTWAPHEIVAKYTFDGVTLASEPCTCHVTGLPYTAAPPTNTGAHLWTISRGKEKISFTNTYVEFTTSGTSKSDPLIQSPSFQIPANINVVVESSFILKANQVWPVTYNSEIFLWISGEKKYTKTHKSTTEKQYNESIEGIINTSKPYIEIEKNGTTALTGSAKFMSVIVKYR